MYYSNNHTSAGAFISLPIQRLQGQFDNLKVAQTKPEINAKASGLKLSVCLDPNTYTGYFSPLPVLTDKSQSTRPIRDIASLTPMSTGRSKELDQGFPCVCCSKRLFHDSESKSAFAHEKKKLSKNGQVHFESLGCRRSSDKHGRKCNYYSSHRKSCVPVSNLLYFIGCLLTLYTDQNRPSQYR